MKIALLTLFLFLELICPTTLFSRSNPMEQLQFNRLSAFDDLPSEEVTRILQDSNGFLWIATNNGFCRYDGYRIRTYKDNLFTSGILPSNAIRCLTEDQENRLWIGTNNGVCIMDLTTGNIRRMDDSRVDDKIVSELYTSSDGSVWMGLDEGLFRYIPGQDSLTLYDRLPDGRRLKGVKTLLEDSRGRLWIGAWSGGLVRYDRESDRFTAYPQLDERNSVHFLFEDSKQTLWAGTWDAGLHRLEQTDSPETIRWKSYHHEENRANSLSDNIIYSIEEDIHTHSLWVGTRSGLSILDLNEPEKDQFVNYLLEDRLHNIWIGGHLGLSVLQPDGTGVHLTDHPTTPDSTSLRYAYNYMIETRGGQLWLGTNRLHEQPLRITGRRHLQHPGRREGRPMDDMPYEQRSALSPKAPLFTEKIRLEYDQNNFSIEFSSLSYLNPSKNKYAYRLDGYDTDWQYTDASNRTANYSSLPAGTYLFRLKGSNENGLWSDAGRTLTIEVLPPVWKITAACQLIEEKKRMRISELAYAVGFNDPKYFSACFRKEFGLLPTEYMEKFAEDSPAEGDREPGR